VVPRALAAAVSLRNWERSTSSSRRATRALQRGRSVTELGAATIEGLRAKLGNCLFGHAFGEATRGMVWAGGAGGHLGGGGMTRIRIRPSFAIARYRDSTMHCGTFAIARHFLP
jgi:hypothetical protein